MNDQTTQETGSCCNTASSEQRRFIDPVCGMAVDGNNPALSIIDKGIEYHFCSTHCRKAFAIAGKEVNSEGKVNSRKNHALPIGIIGSSLLILVFLLVVVLANGSTVFAFAEIKRLWYWVLLLSAGFGLQLGLFIHIRYMIKEKMVGATAEVAASGAVSTGSMIACCSHGLVNLLPVFGISTAAVFLARYQLPFILFGVFSNLVGITIMMGLAQKNGITFSNPILRLLATLNMKIVRLFLIISGSIAIGISILVS